MTSSTVVGVRRSRSAAIVWVDCAGSTVTKGEPVLVALGDESFVAQVVLPAGLLFAPPTLEPVGWIVAVGMTSAAVAAGVRDRDRVALEVAREKVGPGVGITSAHWSLDLATLTLNLAGPSRSMGELRQKLGAQFRAVIRLEWAVEEETFP